MASTAPEEVARTRRRLLEAAADEFLAHGFSGARLKDIALAAGLTTGAIYGQFRNKEALLLAAIFEDPPSTFDAAQTDGTSRGASLLEILHDAVRMVGEPDPQRTRSNLLLLEAFVTARQSDAFADALRETLAEQRSQAVDVLRAGATTGQIRDDIDFDEYVEVLTALLIGLAFTGTGILRRPGPLVWSVITDGLVGNLAP